MFILTYVVLLIFLGNYFSAFWSTFMELFAYVTV